jgi:hypothetical protein
MAAKSIVSEAALRRTSVLLSLTGVREATEPAPSTNRSNRYAGARLALKFEREEPIRGSRAERAFPGI